MKKISLWNVLFPNRTQTTLVNAVRESNIPDELKPAINAKLSAYDKAKTLENTILKEKILHALADCDTPVRINGFFVNCPNAVFPDLTTQKVAALLRELVDAGAVERSEVKSDVPMTLPNGKIIFPTVAYFAIRS